MIRQPPRKRRENAAWEALINERVLAVRTRVGGYRSTEELNFAECYLIANNRPEVVADALLRERGRKAAGYVKPDPWSVPA